MGRFLRGIAVWALGALPLAWFSSVAAAQPVRFDGHRVVRVQIGSPADLDRALALTDDVWTHDPGPGPLDMRVSPEQFKKLQASGLPFSVLIEDVQARIDENRSGIAGGGPFDDYMPLSDVNAYLDALAALRPDLAQTFVAGNSLEGRPIKGIRVTGPGGGPRPATLIHGGQHAREWITVPVTIYVADQLIRNYDTDPYLHELTDRAEWYLIPVMNPDGYEFTWTTNRMWRKNRRPNAGGSFGVDLNRNWGYQWGGEGASTNPSNDTYRGTGPFSEPETQVMRDFMIAHPNIVNYCDLHSYSQLVMWPWGYTAMLSPDDARFARVGRRMAEIVRAPYGTIYDPGPVYTTIYPASGVSVDWAYGDRGIFAMTSELRDTGTNGFLLPPAQILPTSIEVFGMLTYMVDAFTSPILLGPTGDNPELAPPNQPTPVDVYAWDMADTVAPGSVRIHWRIGSAGPFATLTLSPDGDDRFSGTLPARGCGAPTEYYFEAAGSGGAVAYEPFDAPAHVLHLAIGNLTTFFADDFESDLGWTTQNQNVASGAWIRAEPVGTTSGGQQVQPELDHTADPGQLCWVTGNGNPGQAASFSDLDGGPTRLISPMFDLSGKADAAFSFYGWFFNDDGDDRLTVEVSNNDGSSWVSALSISDNPHWTYYRFTVADLLPLTNQMRVRFSATDFPNNSLTEAAVDDFLIETITCAEPLRGDMNCDGVVDNSDIDGFVLALIDPAGYASTYPQCDLHAGDCNGDGVVDNSDIDSFVAILLGG